MTIKSILSSTIIVFYACTIMYMLLDIDIAKMSPKAKLWGAVYFVAFLAINISTQIIIGPSLYGKFYLLLTQLPVFFLFLIISNYRGIKLFFVLLTAVFFSSAFMVLKSILSCFFLPLAAATLLCYLALTFFVYRFLKKPFNYMLCYGDNRMFLLFSTIPLFHYIYSYASTQYQLGDIVVNKQYFIRQIPLIIVLISYILLAEIFKMISEKAELENAQILAALQVNAATEQIERLRIADKQFAIYRHDLRHHMNYLNACISENKLQDATTYIMQTCEDIDNTKVEQYSQNESINLILSSYVGRAKEKGIAIELNVTATDFSRFHNTDLCSLLSNALENAIKASSQTDDFSMRYVKLRLFEKNNRLCMDLCNGYTAEPIFEHKIPVSQTNGHGIGVKSIIHVVEKYKGIYRFTAKDGEFRFQMSM